MPEVVDDSAEASAEATPDTEADPTPAVEDVATYKARLAGKDRAYTALKAEAETQKQLVAELSRWKAEKEAADLTEVERYQRRIADLEAQFAAAESAAKRLQLAKDFPLASDFLGDDLASLSEAKLAEIEERLKAKSEPAEPPIDANNPRRPVPTTPKEPKEKTIAELTADLAQLGNPFAPGATA